MAQPKTYPRDIMCRGRVRCKLLNKDGTPCQEGITTRKQLYVKLAEEIKENIKKMPPPQQRPPTKAQQKAAAGGGKQKTAKKKKKKKK